MTRDQAIELATRCAAAAGETQSPPDWVVDAILQAAAENVPAYVTYQRDDESHEAVEAYAAMCACLSAQNVKALANHLAHGVRATMGGGRIALTRDDWTDIKFLPLERFPTTPASAPG